MSGPSGTIPQEFSLAAPRPPPVGRLIPRQRNGDRLLKTDNPAASIPKAGNDEFVLGPDESLSSAIQVCPGHYLNRPLNQLADGSARGSGHREAHVAVLYFTGHRR